MAENIENKYHAVLFDLDGTLIDTAVDMIYALATLADNHSIKHSLNVAEYRQYISQGAVALVQSVFNNPPPKELKLLRSEYLEIYQRQLNTHSQLFEGVAALINHLDEHETPWGIVTNKPSWLAQPIVANTPELINAKILVCADEVGVAKPDPKPLIHAAQAMNIQVATTLYLGDAQSDIDAAHAAGMLSAIAMWGYLAPEDKPEEWLAHHRFSHPELMIKSMHWNGGTRQTH
ncbi:HAD family hydrolase [Marinicella litoralis]|uniref:Phosphoglycolate phosphatase n=1 Tax=Marinicella litoralis TaxID=644220 RepID=A0A4R6XYR3_9GAMM|nr:HAD-IA family hydrolase [Marinicella litoralis]TDR23670.1 phosphoglycolate phosphatase [Marinicella litoralis]